MVATVCSSSVGVFYIGECVCVCVYPSDGIHVVACSPIGTKFGTHVQIHLQMVVS